MARREERTKKRGAARESIRDKARKAAEQKERGGGGLDTLQNLPPDIEFFKPKKGRGEKGKNNFSIVPYVVSIPNHPFQEVSELWHECTYWQHKVGVGDDSKRFICLKKTVQSSHKRCPICEYREDLIKKGNDPELADSLKPKQRQIFNVLDHEDEDKGIQLFEISPYQFGLMLDDEDRAQADDFDGKFYGDCTDGLAIKARFSEGSFGGHKFPEIARIDFEERDDLSADVLEGAVDLDAALRILTPEEMEKKFFELDGGEEDEPDEEPEERSKKSGRSEKAEKKLAPKEQRRTKKEEPEDDPDDEEDEAPTPPPKRKMKPAPEPEPEEDDDDNDNECPGGMEFGKDCDTDDACDDCDKWDDCKDAQDALKAAGRKKEK